MIKLRSCFKESSVYEFIILSSSCFLWPHPTSWTSTSEQISNCNEASFFFWADYSQQACAQYDWHNRYSQAIFFNLGIAGAVLWKTRYFDGKRTKWLTTILAHNNKLKKEGEVWRPCRFGMQRVPWLQKVPLKTFQSGHFSDFHFCTNDLEVLWRYRLWFFKSGWGLRVYTANYLPGGADAAGLQATFWIENS